MSLLYLILSQYENYSLHFTLPMNFHVAVVFKPPFLSHIHKEIEGTQRAESSLLLCLETKSSKKGHVKKL